MSGAFRAAQRPWGAPGGLAAPPGRPLVRSVSSPSPKRAPRRRTLGQLSPFFKKNISNPTPLAAWLAVRRGRGGEPAAVDASDAGELAAAAGASTMGEHGNVRSAVQDTNQERRLGVKFAWL